MSLTLLICVDRFGAVQNGTVYYDKLFDLAAKLTAGVQNSDTPCQDIDSDRVFNLDGKYYIRVDVSESCMNHMISSGLIKPEEIMTEDDLADWLEKKDWDQIPDENIVDYDGNRLHQMRAPGSSDTGGGCTLC